MPPTVNSPLHVTGPLENGDYTDAIKSVDAVVHTAGPVAFDSEHFEERQLKTALDGTMGTFEAVAKCVSS